MLELRPNCECCDKDLPPEAMDALICTFECTFCADCGTSIAYLDQGLPEELYLTIGFFDHPERFAPQAHAYWDMKLPWVEFPDDLPRVGRYSRRRDPAVGNPADR
ncbi:MAG: DUF1272 domain-containing protein [Mesorhizobium sp.]|nr:MAG: DUF1272 domain-containing protein [Mesorhizobium sp.]